MSVILGTMRVLVVEDEVNWPSWCVRGYASRACLPTWR